MDYDVVVAGAGVAGSMAATEAARNGAKVGLFEDHAQVGVPSHCSGVVSLNGLRLLGLDTNPLYDQRLISGARFHPPTSETIQVTSKEPVAVIINRMRFDQYLVKQAMKEGVDLHTKARVTNFERSGKEVTVSVQDLGEVRAKILIDSSGAGSRLALQAGLKTPNWSDILPGLQYELIGTTKKQDDMVDLFFGSVRAPGFFAWSIPTGDYSIRAGLATSKGNVKTLLSDLVRDNWPESKIDSTKSGSVLVSGAIDKCWSPGFMVVGDAAGQVKQTTGGGIVIGGFCGLLAGRAAANAVKSPARANEYLAGYDSLWREKFAGDLRSMGLARRLFANLSDNTLDKMLPALEPYLGEIEMFGDMDFQGNIITRLLSKRQLAGLLPRIAMDNIRSLFS